MADENRPQHPSVRRERTDASFRWVAWTVAAAAVLGVLLHYGVLWFFGSYNRYLDRERQSPYPLAAEPRMGLPPRPRLEQVDRMEGLPATREEPLAELRGYGPTKDKGYVHIPIDRAIDYLAGKLPARDPAEIPSLPDSGLVDHGEPNSGRLFRTGVPGQPTDAAAPGEEE